MIITLYICIYMHYTLSVCCMLSGKIEEKRGREDECMTSSFVTYIRKIEIRSVAPVS